MLHLINFQINIINFVLPTSILLKSHQDLRSQIATEKLEFRQVMKSSDDLSMLSLKLCHRLHPKIAILQLKWMLPGRQSLYHITSSITIVINLT